MCCRFVPGFWQHWVTTAAFSLGVLVFGVGGFPGHFLFSLSHALCLCSRFAFCAHQVCVNRIMGTIVLFLLVAFSSSLAYMLSVLFLLPLLCSSLFWGFPGGSDGKESVCNAGDPGSIPGSGRSPGGGHGNPLQSSCLQNPMDRGAWRATVHGVAESDTIQQLTLSRSYF